MGRPKISIGSWAFSFGPFAGNPWPFEKVLRYAAEAGYDGIELNGFRPHPHHDDYDTAEKCRPLKKLIGDLGLGVSGHAADFTAVPPALVETKDYLATVRKCLFVCEQLGAKKLRVDTVSPPDELAKDEYEKRFARLAKNWRAAADEAAKSGVQVVWEFEPGFWLNKPSEVKRIVEAVDSDNFKLLFDTSHAYMGAVVGARQTGKKETLGGGVAEYAKFLGDMIGHLHLIDSDGTLHGDETSTHTPFGEGNIDFAKALAPIKALISGLEWWTADYCFCAETETAAKDGAKFLKNLVKEIVQ
ncbi:MAG TPA: sugar phosphate isomerase/epimerase family protein [Sedimentisphaerales bacterium]|nr:sugar phosphate isomerase/epimerase family protein [Sedimentisphaerales bacterium]